MNNDAAFGEAIEVYQTTVAKWVCEVFGEEYQESLQERAIRHIEEAIEICQSADVSEEQILATIRQVYNKAPNPNIGQEIGQNLLTLLALSESAGYHLGDEFQKELMRISQQKVKDRIRVKRSTKLAGDEGLPALT